MVHEHLEKYGMIGAANAVSLPELSRRLTVKQTTLKRIIRAERIGGALICSNACGYFMPESRAEIAQCYDMMRKAAICRLETMKPFRAALRQQDGQMKLFED